MLLVAWYVAGREGLLLGIAVAIVALPAALYRPRHVGVERTLAGLSYIDAGGSFDGGAGF